MKRPKEISQKDFESIPKSYRGEWTRGIWEFRGGDFPEEWIGKKTMLELDENGVTCLLTEGEHFIIIA